MTPSGGRGPAAILAVLCSAAMLLFAEPAAAVSPSPDGTSGAAASDAAASTAAASPAATSPASVSPPMNPKCPVLTEEDSDPSIFTDYQGRRVWFCCPKCRRKFLENPAAYLANLPPVPGSRTTVPNGKGGGGHRAAAGSDTAIQALSSKLRLIRFLGLFHPLAIHFPIALILAAAAAELGGWLARSRRLLDAARLAIGFGALGAAVAAGLGWAAWMFARYPAELAAVLSIHRWLGTATAVVALAAAGWAATGGEWENAVHRRLYRLLLFTSAILVGVTGHFGGTLVFGRGYIAW